MSRKKNMVNQDPDSVYLKGYYDGMRDTFDNSEFDAYYAGVGFGKMKAKDKHIGFNSQEEREAFERGIEHKDKHFKSVRAYRSFWERLFGIGRKESRMDSVKIKNSRADRLKRVKKNWKGGRNKAQAQVNARHNNNSLNEAFNRIDPGRKTSRIVRAPARNEKRK